MNKDTTQPIIKAWELRNFQSIRETKTLDLKPLTIFSGPNSSGKSAVIKSLLMVAQSLGSSAREVPLVLNGKYTQLGEFDHILHHGSDPPEITLGFVIKQQERDIQVRTRIKKDETPTSLTSMQVVDSIVFWGNRAEECFELKPEPVDLSEDEKRGTSQIVREQIDQGLFNYKIIKPAGIESSLQYEETVSASLANFLPGRALRRFKSEIRKATVDIEQAIEVILTTGLKEESSIPVDLDRKLNIETQRRLFGKVLSELQGKTQQEDPYRKAVNSLASAQKPSTIDDVTEAIVNVKGVPENQVEGLTKNVTTLMSSALPGLQRELNSLDSFQETELETREFPFQYNEIIQQIRRVFGRQIFYLGPLRDDPRTIYAIPPLPNQRDVGLKGEYTAAMLEEHKNTPVRYPQPPSPEEKFEGEYQPEDGTLEEAVKVWLQRMGLAESFQTDMTSKVGYQLAVRPEGVKQDLDLMSLGVGVSQVLPTIVMALLAPEDSVLIFEQPEVHLHPKVQSVLGDFFLGIVNCGKQCIVETHSEHLINRIRRRIAESRDEKILQELGIYFVQLKDGVSQFRLVEPNEYGAILDWPNDFFDETGKESEEIIIAALAKQNETMGELSKKTRRRKRQRK